MREGAEEPFTLMDTRPSEVSAGRGAELSASSKARMSAVPILGGETWVMGGGLSVL